MKKMVIAKSLTRQHF